MAHPQCPGAVYVRRVIWRVVGWGNGAVPGGNWASATCRNRQWHRQKHRIDYNTMLYIYWSLHVNNSSMKVVRKVGSMSHALVCVWDYSHLLLGWPGNTLWIWLRPSVCWRRRWLTWHSQRTSASWPEMNPRQAAHTTWDRRMHQAEPFMCEKICIKWYTKMSALTHFWKATFWPLTSLHIFPQQLVLPGNDLVL